MKVLQPVLKAASVEWIEKNPGRSSEINISLLVDSFVCGKVDGDLIRL